MSGAASALLVRYLMMAVWAILPATARERLSKPVGGPLLLAGIIVGVLTLIAIFSFTEWVLAGKP